MPKLISKVKFTSNAMQTPSSEQRYLLEDVEQLKSLGAEDLMPIGVSYKEDAPVIGLIGISKGQLMNASDEWIALPCPPYCHPGPSGENREQGELTFQEALTMVKS